MTTGPGLFDDPRLDEAWRAYVACDRRLAPPPDLEGRTLLRWQGAKVSASAAKGRFGGTSPMLAGALGLAATIAVAVMTSSPAPPAPATPVLQTRAMASAAMPLAVSPDRPVKPLTGATRPPLDASSDLYVQHVELPSVLMMFDAGPAQDSEPLQLVRLRLPREALQALGLALLEPDASGVVDVDVLIGEDGLPRDIRRVRMGREHR